MSTCKQQSKESRELKRKRSHLRSFARAGQVSKPVESKATDFWSHEDRKTGVKQAGSVSISEAEVYNAFLRVRANTTKESRAKRQGIDRQSVEMFESDLEANLYKLQNRMSSGSYFPRAVKRVEIPKPGGKPRPLGIPTVTDRIAQQVVKNRLEPALELIFHKDSYGYRPKRSTLHALRNTRTHCWRREWTLDLDIQGFFDNIDHGIMMDLTRKHTNEKWILLYVERWLKAPIAMPDGLMKLPDKGTPQGGVISPLLANLYLHYAFDTWMETENPTIPFERYADDVVAHCVARQQAARLHLTLKERMKEFKLTLHPEKTKVVYCKDTGRFERHPLNEFNFLGHTFKAWKSKQGKGILTFGPGISMKAIKKIEDKVTDELKWTEKTDLSLSALAMEIRPALMGWVEFYGEFNKPALRPLLNFFNQQLVTWATQKYPRFKGNKLEAEKWLTSKATEHPSLFYHWKYINRHSRSFTTWRHSSSPSSKSSSTSALRFSSSTSSSKPNPSPPLPPRRTRSKRVPPLHTLLDC